MKEPLTRSEIREWRQNSYSTWEILGYLIHECGMEFPDASARVALALNMDTEEVEQMEKDYDEIA